MRTLDLFPRHREYPSAYPTGIIANCLGVRAAVVRPKPTDSSALVLSTTFSSNISTTEVYRESQDTATTIHQRQDGSANPSYLATRSTEYSVSRGEISGCIRNDGESYFIEIERFVPIFHKKDTSLQQKICTNSEIPLVKSSYKKRSKFVENSLTLEIPFRILASVSLGGNQWRSKNSSLHNLRE